MQIGVPFHEQARIPGEALDCAGVVTASAGMAGVDLEDLAGYNIKGSDYSEKLIEYARLNADEVTMDAAIAGDVVLFWIGDESKPRHIGILVPGSKGNSLDLNEKFNLVHTSNSAGKVIMHPFSAKWQRHAHSTWRIRKFQEVYPWPK